MNRLVLGLVLLTAACGGKSSLSPGDSLCKGSSPPAECKLTCDPASGAGDACPIGFHCAENATCDTECTAGGAQCGAGKLCTSDGFCTVDDGNSGGDDTPPIDADCPAIHFTPKKITPSVQILIDRSGSMAHNFADKNPSAGDPVKYTTVHDALTGPAGVITQLQGQVLFGASLYSDDAPCPKLSSVPRALGNKTAIDTLIGSQNPGGFTPTPPAIHQAVDELVAHPTTDSPSIIVLATDGLPNKCGDRNADTQAESVAEAKRSFDNHIKLFVLSVGNTAGTAAHFQALANAGQGAPAGQNASYFPATTPDELARAFQTIISGVLSCDVKLDKHVDTVDGQGGTVTLDGVTLMPDTEWSLDADGITIHLLGAACTKLKSEANPVVDAAFVCGTPIF